MGHSDQDEIHLAQNAPLQGWSEMVWQKEKSEIPFNIEGTHFLERVFLKTSVKCSIYFGGPCSHYRRSRTLLKSDDMRVFYEHIESGCGHLWL